jgi:3-hydroxyisobutyrate dehydrogenase
MNHAMIRRVGFVGLGNMGWPMAARLVHAGFDVTAFDIAPGRAEAFAAETGGRAAATPRAAVRDAEAVITIVPTSAQVADAVAGMDDGLQPGTLLIDMTSGQPGRTRDIASALAAASVAMVDCPVSGGVPRAKSGELAIMAGGADADLDRAEPLLRAMGTTIHRCGPIGAGQAMKALNNLASAGAFMIGVEALLIGARAGLDPALMVDVLNASSGMTNSTQKKFKQFVLSRRFDSGFSLELMLKDVSIALELGRDTETPTPIAALVRELSAAAVALLGPGQDHTAVAQLAEKLAGETLGGNK